MLKQQLPNIYSEALHYLTTGGTAAAVRCNNNDGEIFTVETGSGQAVLPTLKKICRPILPKSSAAGKKIRPLHISK
jgi:hypothetical protein